MGDVEHTVGLCQCAVPNMGHLRVGQQVRKGRDQGGLKDKGNNRGSRL